MEPSMVKVATNDGANIVTWSTGPHEGEVVMLVHGFSLDHSTWDEVATGLTERGFRVITADLRGHGRSSDGSEVPTADRFVADIEAIMSTLDLATAHLVGHSLGAVIALTARTSVRLDGRLKSVSAVAGTARSIQNPVMRLGAFLFSTPVAIRLLGQQRIGRMMISTWFGKSPDAAQLDRVRLLSASCPRATRTRIAKATGSLDLRPTFAKPGPPTQLICGRRDKATPLKFSTGIAAAIAGSKLTAFDDAGHMVMIEKPDQVVAALSEWIDASS